MPFPIGELDSSRIMPFYASTFFLSRCLWDTYLRNRTMPKLAKALSAIEIKRLTEPGLHAVGNVPGLNLRISDTGAKTWALRVSIQGRQTELGGIGGYPGIPLASALEKARELRQRVKDGYDPGSEKRATQQAEQRTFKAIAETYIAAHTPGWRNAKHAAQWASTLTTYAYPHIGDKPASEITTEDVLACLTPIWNTKNETANRLRNRIELVLSYSMAIGHRPRGLNPAAWRGCIDQLLPKPSKVAAVKHHEAVDWRYAIDFAKLLRNREGTGARCLELVLLAACRSNEARLATWDEFDLVQKIWNVPGPHTKSGRPHRIPISAALLALLDGLPRFVDKHGEPLALVFPGQKNQPLSDMTLTAVMRRMGLTAVPHGLRSTFRDWAAESTSYPNEVVEMALAHIVGSATEAAYRRGDLFDKRRELMDSWADYLAGGN